MKKVFRKPAIAKKLRIYNDLLKKEAVFLKYSVNKTETFSKSLAIHNYVSYITFFTQKNPDFYIPGTSLVFDNAPYTILSFCLKGFFEIKNLNSINVPKIELFLRISKVQQNSSNFFILRNCLYYCIKER